MSRVGLLPVQLAEKVSVDVAKNNVVTVTGPKGELTLQVDPDIRVSVDDGTVVVARPTDQKRHKAMHGLYRSLINGMVTGVSEGFRKELEIIGVGFRAAVNNGVLELPSDLLRPAGGDIDFGRRGPRKEHRYQDRWHRQADGRPGGREAARTQTT